MYLMVLEVVLLGIVVFIIAPILLVGPSIIGLYFLCFNRTTAVLEHIPHLCWSAPTADLCYDQT